MSDAERVFRPAMPGAWQEVIDQSPFMAYVADFYLDRYELVNLLRWRQFQLWLDEYERWGLPVSDPAALIAKLA